MRYQQKQKVELEQKRNEMIGSNGVGSGRGLAALDTNENNKMLPALIGNGNGKVSEHHNPIIILMLVFSQYNLYSYAFV